MPQRSTGEPAHRHGLSFSRGALGICQLLLPLRCLQDEPVVLGLLGPPCLLLLSLQGTNCVQLMQWLTGGTCRPSETSIPAYAHPTAAVDSGAGWKTTAYAAPTLMGLMLLEGAAS